MQMYHSITLLISYKYWHITLLDMIIAGMSCMPRTIPWESPGGLLGLWLLMVLG